MLNNATVDHASRGASQVNQVAGERENPKTDRKNDQHGMDGMLEDARLRMHWRTSLDG
jgi:hypothetical protein